MAPQSPRQALLDTMGEALIRSVRTLEMLVHAVLAVLMRRGLVTETELETALEPIRQQADAQLAELLMNIATLGTTREPGQ